MMVLTGLAFVLVYLLVQVFSVELLHAILAIGIVYIVIGLLVGEGRPYLKRP